MKTLQAGLLALMTVTAVLTPANAVEPAQAPAATGVWTEPELINSTWQFHYGGRSGGPIECVLRANGHVTSRKGKGLSERDIRKWELREGGRKLALLIRTNAGRENDHWFVSEYKDANVGVLPGSQTVVQMTRVK